MSEPQPSPQQKRTRSIRQTKLEKLSGYRKVLQDIHDLLLPEGKLDEVLLDEMRVPTFKDDLRNILAWIKTVENREEIINSFNNVLGNEIDIFKEHIEGAIYYMIVVLEIRTQEKQALEKKQIEVFSQCRLQALRMLAEGRKHIHKALLLLK